MANTKVTQLVASNVVVAPHPITGKASNPRRVTAITVHPTFGVTVYYDDPFGPTFHMPTDTVTTQ